MFYEYINIHRILFVIQEIGDVENWAKSIETDMRTISTALEYTYKKSRFHNTSIYTTGKKIVF